MIAAGGSGSTTLQDLHSAQRDDPWFGFEHVDTEKCQKRDERGAKNTCRVMIYRRQSKIQALKEFCHLTHSIQKKLKARQISCIQRESA